MNSTPFLGAWLFALFSSSVSAATSEPSAEQCIAAHSGADSLLCLQELEQSLQKQIHQQQAVQQKKWRSRRDLDELTDSHYQQAMSENRLANRYFAEFTHKQCLSQAGASGAVGSGSGQIYWSCRITWSKQRLENLLKQKN